MFAVAWPPTFNPAEPRKNKREIMWYYTASYVNDFFKNVQHVSMLTNLFAIDCCLLCSSNVTLIDDINFSK